MGPSSWRVTFSPETENLVAHHKETGAHIEGVLTFVVYRDRGEQSWSIVGPRDPVRNRLSLLDERGNVQGYLTFGGSGDLLEIAVIHRSAQNYDGELAFVGQASLAAKTFACRTVPPSENAVLQMASGLVDSGLNDSLFDLKEDVALRFAGEALSITTAAQQGERPAFNVKMKADPAEPRHSVLAFQVIRNYYRDRWVPYYKPINKARCPSPPTGWMSWNVYFDTAGEKENLEEARIGAKHLLPFGLEIWHIESWQDNSDKLPVSQFHNLTLRPNPRQFPRGMKWLADQIRALGFKPGIWTVPFGTGDHAFYEAHKEWFLHHPDGSPMENWSGLYVLDPSQKAVRDHIEETHRIMSQDWGYAYFKIDGMSGRSESYSAHFYERDEVRAAFRDPYASPFRSCCEAIRRGIGPDRVWLACQGHYSGPEVGLADAGRLGADIVHPNKPPEWGNYLNQARTTLNQLFVHNIVWYGDPDTLMVGERASLDVARLATAVVGLTGQMMFSGDKLAQLPPERMRLLQQCLPVCDIRPLDLFPIFEMRPVWDLKIRRSFGDWDVLSVFNWDEREAQTELAFASLGLNKDQEYLVYDGWAEKCLGGYTGDFSTTVSGRSNRLYFVHPNLNRPQFLATDRHITGGGTSVKALSWDEENKRLTGTINVVAGYPSKITIAVPSNYEVKNIQDQERHDIQALSQDDATLSFLLQRPTSGPLAWHIDFLVSTQ